MNRDEIIRELRAHGLHVTEWWEVEILLDTLDQARSMVDSSPAVPPAAERPTVVTLCGSTRFYEAWQEAIFNETMAGRIVLSVGFYPHAADKAHAAHVGVTPEQKIALDVLHKQKIEMSDEILVLNVGGYIGDSTRSEIEYAQQAGKRVRYLEPPVANSSSGRTPRFERGEAGSSPALATTPDAGPTPKDRLATILRTALERLPEDEQHRILDSALARFSTSMRCGTCGSDDPGWQKPPCTQVDEPDTFHSLPAVCPTCKSSGFPVSVLGEDRCSFCDGTEGGNPPAGKEARDGE